MEELFTLGEAARFLKVHERTLRRWIAEGRLPAVKIARTVRIRRDTLEVMTRPQPAANHLQAIDRLVERRQRRAFTGPSARELFEESRKMLEERCPQPQS